MTTQPALKHKEYENIVPFRSLGMLEEMERMFENIVPHGWTSPFRWERSLLGDIAPAVDVIDCDDHVLVRAAMPGVKKEDLEVSTTDHTCTIRGSTKYEASKEEGEYYRREISCGNFLRTVTLPASVDESKAKATFRDGMLELKLPKRESSRRHTVKIETK